MATDAGTPAPVEAAAPAPIPEVQAPSPEPVAAVQADQPATVPAPAAEAPAPAAGVEPPAQPEVPKSLLDKFDEKATPAVEAKPEDKPAEEAKPEAAPVEEPKPAPEPEKAPPAEPVKLDPIDWFAEDGGLKIPEVITLDDANRTKLTEALELGRTDPAKGAQALMDMHAEALDQFAADMHTRMWTEFGKTREGWVNRVMADAELGGAAHDTAMGRSARMRDIFVSRHEAGTKGFEADQADWKEMMQATGVGDHPAFHRFMNNIARKFDEASPPPPDPKPPKDLGRKPGQGKGLNYTHPTSQPDN